MISLGKYSEMLHKCTVCHDQCMAYTPELKFLENHSYVTSRKALLLKLIVDKQLDWDKEIAEVVYTGLNSGLQTYNCMFPTGQDETLFLRAARAELVEKNMLPHTIQNVKKKLTESGNVFGESFVGSNVVGNGKIGIIFDSATRVLTPEVREAAIQWFKMALNEDLVIIDVASSGFLEYDLGFVQQAKESAEQVVKVIEEHGINNIISTDPTIIYAIKEIYKKEFGIDFTFSALHAAEWIAEHLDTSLKEIQLDGNITYHDPSEMARYLNIVDEPRRIISHTAGANFVEMKYNKEQARPTGAKVGYPHETKVRELARKRIKDIEEVRAKYVVTSSPYSKYNLQEENHSDIKIFDLVEWVAMSTNLLEKSHL